MRCPCGMPVEVSERFVLTATTAGLRERMVPIEHVKGVCAVGHRFCCAVEFLADPYCGPVFYVAEEKS